MSLRYKLLFAFLIFSFIGSIAYSASYYHSKYQSEKLRADDADKRANSSETITANVLRAVVITNQILEANQHAKQQIALESQRAENDIKAAVSDDDCAVRVVPSGAVKRLHEYADGIRAGSGGSVTSQPDSRNPPARLTRPVHMGI
ncbi:DUF2570 domain-containing protein [Lelliottia nimipressuralis]|uniref:DUF2570 domain-containing protein n=1 Tax=Lelliottia nimipressuralis TaxID=69220 RepID=A0ABD4KDJ4_9ENTR|nr:DUF2570 domain-containing protein [Lelliottia nimipressuralis]MBF4179096.1 DUF2570 domain-containing protein [Lelliottia nimipressuralis]